MTDRYRNMPDGYQESINKGLGAAMHFRHMHVASGMPEDQLARLKKEIDSAEAIIVGAGAGLSTAAGFTYSGERFDRFFSDFGRRFGIKDMYSGGFYPFPDAETRWAWWARAIYCNRYMDAPKPVYNDLLSLLEGKDYFVITTNVDHQFQKAGIDKKRLFYTQGDYGLFQSVSPGADKTYDNEDWVMKAMDAQGFVKDADGVYQMPKAVAPAMRIPAELLPKCPDDGSDMTTNLRVDDNFAEDAGWHQASAAYADFLRRHEGMHVLYLELGVGANTPVIIKYPFWQMTRDNKNAVYACVNYGETYCPDELAGRSILLDGDFAEILEKIR